MSKKECELCSKPARMFCESDQASLCWECDEKVHAANFLVAKHSRTLLCHVCRSPTPWKADGPRLGATVSVCHACARRRGPAAHNQRQSPSQIAETDADREYYATDSDDDSSEEGEDDEEEEVEEDGENQVVPWSASLPAASSSSAEEDNVSFSSSKRTRDCAFASSEEYNQIDMLHMRAQVTQQAELAEVWREKCRRAEELYNFQCTEFRRLEARVAELECLQADTSTINEAVTHKMLEDSKKIQAGYERVRARQVQIDELCAKLLHAEEELEVANGRADQILKDHERIVEEHAEYEDIIHRAGGFTISEMEARIDETLQAYADSKRAGGADSSGAVDALKKLKKMASFYGLILQRRPRLREFLLKQNEDDQTLAVVNRSGASSSRARPDSRKRGGRTTAPSSRGRRGGRSSGSSRGGRVSIDDVLSADASSFVEKWLSFGRSASP